MTGPNLRLGVPLGPWLATLVVALLIVVVVIGVREHRSLSVPARRRLLDALRVASALCAALLMLQPQWASEQVEEVQGRLAVLLDVSRSMSVREGSGTRLSQSTGALARAFDAAKQKPALYAFGEDITPLTRGALQQGITLQDDTRIERALRNLVAQDSDLGAVLLVSDGADKNAALLAEAARKLGVRVHTLAVGSGEVLGDTSIESLQADGVAFLREPAQVQVQLRVPPGSGPLTVTLRQGAEVVRETDVTPSPDGNALASLTFTPTRLGRAVYSVSVPGDDPVPENNQRAFMVRVVREKLRVLLVCGEPSWDARYLRALLKGNPALDLITFFILRTQNDNSMAAQSELSLIPFPTEELFEQHLSSFDLVIFQDFDFGPYQMGRYLPRIRDYVMNGGSFAMLGGARSFGAGGYQGTPIADVLPVEVAAGDHSIDLAEVTPQLVPEATHHPLVELSPRLSDNAAAWAGLAPLAGVNLLASMREGSQALLVHPKLTLPNGEPMPVLVVGTAGKGRSMALTSDSSFRWGITTGGRTGDASAYERFWDRTLRWLGRDPLLDPAQVSTDRERYGPGAKLRAQVFLRDGRYRPLAQRAVRLTLRDDHGETRRELAIQTDAEGRANAELLAPDAVGAYTLAVLDEGVPEPIAEEVFVVEAGGDELADPRAKPDVLRNLSSATDGRFLRDASDLELDKLSSTRTRSLGTQVYAPFATPWFFLCFVAVFGTEWWLRRRFGLR